MSRMSIRPSRSTIRAFNARGCRSGRSKSAAPGIAARFGAEAVTSASNPRRDIAPPFTAMSTEPVPFSQRPCWEPMESWIFLKPYTPFCSTMRKVVFRGPRLGKLMAAREANAEASSASMDPTTSTSEGSSPLDRGTRPIRPCHLARTGPDSPSVMERSSTDRASLVPVIRALPSSGPEPDRYCLPKSGLAAPISGAVTRT